MAALLLKSISVSYISILEGEGGRVCIDNNTYAVSASLDRLLDLKQTDNI